MPRGPMSSRPHCAPYTHTPTHTPSHIHTNDTQTPILHTHAHRLHTCTLASPRTPPPHLPHAHLHTRTPPTRAHLPTQAQPCTPPHMHTSHTSLTHTSTHTHLPHAQLPPTHAQFLTTRGCPRFPPPVLPVVVVLAVEASDVLMCRPVHVSVPPVEEFRLSSVLQRTLHLAASEESGFHADAASTGDVPRIETLT